MAYPARLLGEGEHIEYETRPHWRVLAIPLLSFLLIVGVTAFLFGKVQANSSWQGGLRWVVFLLAASAFCYWVVRPVIEWATSLYVFTNRRIITRTGLVARRGRDMPLSRVNDVSFSHTVLERIFNCGTLMVESAGESGQLRIDNVPDVEDLQREIYRLHEADDLRRRRDLETGQGPTNGATESATNPAPTNRTPDDGT
jgi:uncharacterized membrane protein YdbT with pleckstrin-like domain